MPLCRLENSFLLLALDEVRYCGASSAQAMRRMNALVKNLRQVLPVGRAEALRYWERRLEDTIEVSFEHKDE